MLSSSNFYNSLQRDLNTLFGDFFGAPFARYEYVDPFAQLDDLRERVIGLLDDYPTRMATEERAHTRRHRRNAVNTPPASTTAPKGASKEDTAPMDKEGSSEALAASSAGPASAAAAPAPSESTTTPAGQATESKEIVPQSDRKIARRTWLPRCDVQETPTEIVLHVELPGIPKEQTKLEVDPESCIVTLSGERKSACEETPEGSAFRRVERQWGMFERSFRLPDACRAKLGEIKARANNGVIEIHCPKAEPPKPVAISIQ